MKIYYNNDGFVCKRYPLDYLVENENQYIEVLDEDYQKTFITKENYAWKVKNGALVNERYKNDNQIQSLEVELEQIQLWFLQNDWVPNKILREEWTKEDSRWVTYKQECLIKRNRQDEIQNILNGAAN